MRGFGSAETGLEGASALPCPRMVRPLRGPPVQYLVFDIRERTFAVPLSLVREVTLPLPLSTVPRAPEAIPGAMCLRGRIIAVVAPECLPGFSALSDDDLSGSRPGTLPDGQTRFVVLESGTWSAALRVRRVGDIRELEAAPWPEGVSEAPVTPGCARLPEGGALPVLDVQVLRGLVDSAILADPLLRAAFAR